MLDLSEALSMSYDEVGYLDFYRDIFPEGSFEKRGVYEDGKYNGIAVSIRKGGKKTKRLTVTDDLEVIEEMVMTDDFCLMSPISYAGKSRKSGNARFMYAMAIDLDGIETLDQWQFFIQQVERGHEMLSFVWGLPKPTYIVSSGTGVHIYYVFQKPVPLFRDIVEQLEVLKRRLTWQVWTQGASSLHDNVQYESLFQGFRVVGTVTKDGGRCRAFRVGDAELEVYMWPIIREMIKTAIENKQNLVIEGGYIPFDWKKDFTEEYLDNIKFYCLVMSENYIKNYFDNIKKYASAVENRIDDDWCTMESVLEDNVQFLELAKKHNANYVLIDDKYEINIDL